VRGVTCHFDAVGINNASAPVIDSSGKTLFVSEGNLWAVDPMALGVSPWLYGLDRAGGLSLSQALLESCCKTLCVPRVYSCPFVVVFVAARPPASVLWVFP
jgi:hypothetical protein